MYELSKELKSAIGDLNKKLGEKFEKTTSLSKVALRDLIEKSVGEIKLIEPASVEMLKTYEKSGGIVGVDGSVNRVGGANPHYVDIFQGLAKSTLNGKSVFTANCDSPLFRDKKVDLEPREELSEEESGRRDKLLAEIELITAIKGIEELKPSILIMDGSLLRYRIYSESLWNELKTLCLERNTILTGVIKDIKTSFISDALRESGVQSDLYDREMLFGKLDYKELIKIYDGRNEKKKAKLSSAFLRSSRDPNPIGIDLIVEQGAYIEEMARLVLSLTPHDSRGVPLWLDIVDREVKLSDALVKALMESTLDRELYEMFIMSERQKRDK